MQLPAKKPLVLKKQYYWVICARLWKNLKRFAAVPLELYTLTFIPALVGSGPSHTLVPPIMPTLCLLRDGVNTVTYSKHPMSVHRLGASG